MFYQIKQYLRRYISKKIWNQRGVFPYYGQKVFFPKNSLIFNRAIKENVYEKENVILMKQLMQDETTVLDIGANIGLMAIPLLALNPSIKLVSVEPSPNSYPYLAKTHQSSSFKDRWQLINKAVADQEGEMEFQLAKPEEAAYEGLRNTARVNFTHSTKVACTTIDQLWHNLGKPQVSVIKIDVEGADLLALKGALACIQQCKPHILMEWSKKNIGAYQLSNRHLLSFSQQIGYQIYALPYFTKCTDINELDLLYQLTENFLLSPATAPLTS